MSSIVVHPSNAYQLRRTVLRQPDEKQIPVRPTQGLYAAQAHLRSGRIPPCWGMRTTNACVPDWVCDPFSARPRLARGFGTFHFSNF